MSQLAGLPLEAPAGGAVAREGLQQSLTRALRAAGAATRRDFRVFTRYRLWLITAVANPILWFLPAVMFGRTFAVNGQVAGFTAWTGVTDYVAFLAVGTIFWQVVFSVMWGVGMSLRREMMQGTLEQNWLTPAPPFAILAGTSLFQFLVTAVQVAVIFGVIRLLFGVWFDGAWLLAGLAACLSAVAMYGFGNLFAALVMVVRDPGALTNIVQIAMLLLCGVHYPITVLPGPLQVLSHVFPMTYGMDVLRGLLMGAETLYPVGISMLLLVGWAVAMPLLGYGAFRLVERRARRLGTLSQY